MNTTLSFESEVDQLFQTTLSIEDDEINLSELTDNEKDIYSNEEDEVRLMELTQESFSSAAMISLALEATHEYIWSNTSSEDFKSKAKFIFQQFIQQIKAILIKIREGILTFLRKVMIWFSKVGGDGKKIKKWFEENKNYAQKITNSTVELVTKCPKNLSKIFKYHDLDRVSKFIGLHNNLSLIVDDISEYYINEDDSLNLKKSRAIVEESQDIIDEFGITIKSAEKEVYGDNKSKKTTAKEFFVVFKFLEYFGSTFSSYSEDIAPLKNSINLLNKRITKLSKTIEHKFYYTNISVEKNRIYRKSKDQIFTVSNYLYWRTYEKIKLTKTAYHFGVLALKGDSDKTDYSTNQLEYKK